MAREKLLSVTAKDFDFEFFRCGGKGGQKQNKTSTGARCRHRASGAVAESRTERDQLGNKRRAWSKCVTTPTFQAWLKIATAKAQGVPTPEEVVEEQLRPEHLKVEVGLDGDWVSA